MRLSFGATSEAYGSPWNDMGFMVTLGNTSGGLRIGTQAVAPLMMIINNSEAMRINSGGNVGIGTTGPYSKLDVLGGNIGLSTNQWLGAYWTGQETSLFRPLIGMVNHAYTAVRSPDSEATDGIAFQSAAGANLMYILDSGNVGIGTTAPGGLLALRGTLSSALTGTVSVTINTATVTGVGTAFTTELAVGDSIKIGSEVFTVSAIASATSLTLDSNHLAGASGATAYRDPTLLAIDNGDAVNKLTITKSGNVGIGTTSPGQKLDVAGNIQVSGGDRKISLGNASAVNSGLYFNTISDQAYYIGRDGTTWGAGLPLIASSYFGWQFKTQNLDRMKITYEGNVGIGTTSPTAALHVASGPIQGQGLKETAYTIPTTPGNAEFLTYNNSASNWGGIGGYTNGGMWLRAQDFSFYTPSTSNPTAMSMHINSSGNVGIGTTSPTSLLSVGATSQFQVNSSGYALLPNGAAATPSLSFTGDTDTGIYLSAANTLGLGTSGVEHMTIDSTGNLSIRGYISDINDAYVGINETLQVTGNLQFETSGTRVIYTASTANALQFDPITAEPTLIGTARHARDLVISPEYPGAVLTASTSATTNGTLTSDNTQLAWSWENYYEWTTPNANLQDYTVAIRITTPSDWASWEATALTVSLATLSTAAADNKVDAYIFNENATPVSGKTSQKSSAAGTWTNFSFSSSDLTGGGVTWNSADDTVILMLKMYAKSSNWVRIGDVTLFYKSKW